ncbi:MULTISPECIES: DUF6843 domain-containing protein [Peribacillus]|uniref:DUF6843 domain-containing protein n=1 Tax=Peribacillus TaxID=2675229 RepID=UPI001F4DD495|nr:MULTISPECIES: hypothetical protein [unclassified Peribacillus]MCK1985766.1 hypothetical protein [Peribacillus sp. Aquil_B1]MCK2010692.1 hypothetical protein [Peribacillus sp. Aquil_B8]
MNVLKVIVAAVILSFIISIIGSIMFYTPYLDRDPDVYYPTIVESFIYGLVYLTPVLIILSVGSFVVYSSLRKNRRLPKWGKVIVSLGVTIGMGIIISLVLSEEGKTNDIYLIPEGYEGDVFVFYNVKGAPEVEKEDGYEVHKINEKGYYATRTKDLDYGTVTDKYFYVNDKGHRTPIDDKCVSTFGTGGTTLEDNIDITYTGFKLRKNNCSEEFSKEAQNEDGNVQMINDILKKYYNMEAQLF